MKSAEESFVRDGMSTRIEVVSEKVFEYLVTRNAPVSEKHLLKQICGRRQLKVLALRDLVLTGKVRRVGTGKKNDPYHYFVWSNQNDHYGARVVEEIVI